MAKLIFRCNYIKGSHKNKEHIDNLVRYVATRENVEKTIELDNLKAKKENFIDYLGNRPRVVKIGEHGLFSNEGEEVNLNKVAEEVSNHKGTIWTNVISIKREDAERLGYNNVVEWQSLLRSKVGMFSEAFKIKPQNLKWYAAFHNEGHHPHVHLVIYSKDENEGFIGKKGIDRLRSSFAHDIFRQDFANIYDEQTASRNLLKDESKKRLENIIGRIKDGTLENKDIEEKLISLAKKLENTKGKKVYGYLKPEVKDLVKTIVDELEKDERIEELYDEWYKSRNEILSTYKNNIPSKISLSEQNEFKSIKNNIIAEALKLSVLEIECENEDKEIVDEYVELNENIKVEPKVKKNMTCWSEEFNKAITLLRNDPKNERAVDLMIKEAERGNALAMYELGRIYSSGKAVEKDEEISYEWYKKSLATFLELEKENIAPYMAYRIGKMFVNGLGTEPNYLEGKMWLEKAKEKHIYAKYLLGVMYQRGLGIEVDLEKAIELYKDVSDSIPYASYEVAKYLEKNEPESKEKINSYYESAYIGFYGINKKLPPEEKNKSTIEYKLGRMLYYGLGTEVNIPKSVEYLTSAGEKGHQYAQFLLGVMYLKVREIRDIDISLKWLEMSAKQGNEYAKNLIQSIKDYQQRYLTNFVSSSVTTLFRQVVSCFEDNIRKMSSEQTRMRLSKKRRRELYRKNKNIKEYEESLTVIGGDNNVFY